MIGVPPLGATVRVWPTPGRQVQLDNRPVDRWAGGRWMPACGTEVKWSPWQQEQLQAGDLMLHPPTCAAPAHGEDKDATCGNCGRTREEHGAHDTALKAALAKLPKKEEAAAPARLFDPTHEGKQHLARLAEAEAAAKKAAGPQDKPAKGTTPAKDKE